MRTAPRNGATVALFFFLLLSPTYGWTTIGKRRTTKTRPSKPQSSSLLENTNNLCYEPVRQRQQSSSILFATTTSSSSSSLDLQDRLVDTLQRSTSSSSDIRGRVIDHGSTITSVLDALEADDATLPQLTPFVAYTVGQALATQLRKEQADEKNDSDSPIIVAIGMDGRTHGVRLADALARGMESSNKNNVRVAYSGVCTTPACATFVRMQKCRASVMVTASHLPRDRNGFKFYSTTSTTGYSKAKIRELGTLAIACTKEWCKSGKVPPSGEDNGAVECTHQVDWMPEYAQLLKEAILRKTTASDEYPDMPLTGLKIILNPGNGAGGFFQHVLQDLGADVSAGMHLDSDGTFPNGVPNPEDPDMFAQTAQACDTAQADLGIMLDTDADRCGFVVPRTINSDGQRADYEALNRNRLIALLGVIFAQEYPGCAVVTDSVTSEGLATFLEESLGLKHVRYLKGYANVINKAKELTESGAMDAELAIETSGHCAMRENSYLDDGTYSAVQIVSLLAREQGKGVDAGLLSLISNMNELHIVEELRMTTINGSLETTKEVFDVCVSDIEKACINNDSWRIDEDNLEGIRVRLGNGQFFMLRMSLHDPIISLQIEAQTREEAKKLVIDPLLKLLEENVTVQDNLDISVLSNF